MMPLPDFVKHLAEKKLTAYCENRDPPHARDQARVAFKIRGDSVTLLEQRTSFRHPEVWLDIPIAQFPFDHMDSKWALYWTDRNGG